MKSESKQIKVVLSGGLCNGKTTTLHALKKLCLEKNISAGFVNEVASNLISNAQKNGSDCLPWKNPQWFQIRLFFMQDVVEKKPQEKFVFMDRCKIDGLAYYWLDNLIPHPLVTTSVEKEKYDLVFFLENLPYKNNDVRVEPEAWRTKITKLTKKAYSTCGYVPIFVPIMDPKTRAEFILEKVIEFSNKE